jgi:microcystin degradation protein MlrC
VRTANLMDNDRTGAYVDAVAALLAMPLDGVDRTVLIGVTERLAAYAADVAAVELAIDVEIAGRFEP